MSRIKDAIEGAFRDAKPREISVPEWEEFGAGTLYVWPETVKQFQQIESSANQYSKAVNIVCIRAMTKDRKRIFDNDDRSAMYEQGVDVFGPEVVSRVALEIHQDRLEGLSEKQREAVDKGKATATGERVENAKKK